MPFYWPDFWHAVEGFSDSAIVAYQRALSHYWHHNHCRGLQDDDEFLRRLCRIEKSEWQKIKQIVFDNDKFFTMDGDGLWHQKRAQEEWIKSSAKYDAAVKGGRNRLKNTTQKQREAISRSGAVAKWKKTRSENRPAL